MTTEDQFHARVDRTAGPTACWPWLGYRADHYGQCVWQGRQLRAHHVAYLLAGHTLPPGHILHHTCHNPLCCNPAHLLACTVAEHNRLHRLLREQTGVSHWARRLTPQQAADCRRYYRRGLATSVELAAIYGISPQRVRHIGTDEPYRALNERQLPLPEATA